MDARTEAEQQPEEKGKNVRKRARELAAQQGKDWADPAKEQRKALRKTARKDRASQSDED